MSGFGKIFPTRKEGPITKALKEGLKLRAQLIADGTPEREADRIVGQGLKAVLQNPRPEPWHFLCERCRDTGFVNVEPSEDERRRLTRLYGPNPQTQGYVEKCEPCRWTQTEREKRRTRDEQEDDSLVAAGQTKRTRRKW